MAPSSTSDDSTKKSHDPPSEPPAAKKPKPDNLDAPNKPATMGGAHEQADKNHTEDDFPDVMPCAL